MRVLLRYLDGALRGPDSETIKNTHPYVVDGGWEYAIRYVSNVSMRVAVRYHNAPRYAAACKRNQPVLLLDNGCASMQTADETHLELAVFTIAALVRRPRGFIPIEVKVVPSGHTINQQWFYTRSPYPRYFTDGELHKGADRERRRLWSAGGTYVVRALCDKSGVARRIELTADHNYDRDKLAHQLRTLH